MKPPPTGFEGWGQAIRNWWNGTKTESLAPEQQAVQRNVKAAQAKQVFNDKQIGGAKELLDQQGPNSTPIEGRKLGGHDMRNDMVANTQIAAICNEAADQLVSLQIQLATFGASETVGPAVEIFFDSIKGKWIAKFKRGMTADITEKVDAMNYSQRKANNPDLSADDLNATITSQGNRTIYKVPGEATPSGKAYIGRHNKPDPAKTRRSSDGRDRTKAEVIDTYDPNDVKSGQVKEQDAMDQNGGVDNLDNKRNEIAPGKRKKK